MQINVSFKHVLLPYKTSVKGSGECKGIEKDCYKIGHLTPITIKTKLRINKMRIQMRINY